jgi:tetratricopeptide (TPR) repeat protein
MGFFEKLWSKSGQGNIGSQSGHGGFSSYLTLEYPEEYDKRIEENYLAIPDMKRFIDFMNTGNVEDAENSFQALQGSYSDFSTVYYWLAATYRRANKFEKGIEILKTGLVKCKMRHSLYTLLGELEFSRKNIDIAIKWWAQSIVAQVQIKKFLDFVPFLYFGYVAMDIPDMSLSHRFFQKGDEIRYGQIRFNPPVANEIHSLMRGYMQTLSADDKKELHRVLMELARISS